MPKPACLKCQRFYRPKKNGFIWCEGMPKENHAEPGISHPEKWEPYKIWSGDLWKCGGCGHELIVGSGYQPISVQHYPDFQHDMRFVKATINDC